MTDSTPATTRLTVPDATTPAQMEGLDLSAKREIWEELARTEMRLQLMTELIKLKVGFADVEEFNLNLKGNLKNPNSGRIGEMLEYKLVRPVMEVKMRDEQVTKTKLIRARNKARTKLSKTLGKNTKRYRTKIRSFQEKARGIKNEFRELYQDKLEHLKLKYREDKEEQMDRVPDEIEEFVHLSVFDREKYARLETKSYEATCVGEITLPSEQMSILKMHPKFAIVEDLKEGGLVFEQELSYAKLRITIQKELDERLENEKELTQEEEEKLEELDAKSRMTFDPINKIYDDRQRRVTDLDECSRVTLPRPLPMKEENLIEIRRNIHAKIYNDYRKEKCGKNGEQVSNLTEEQERGLKSLKKRISEEDLIILKTDKSGKLCVATTEEYIKMGQEHTSKDKLVGRKEIAETEKQINGHSTAWVKMYGTGANNGQTFRVIDSKISRSKNISTMYLVVKDHKKEPGKSRPIVTGNSGHTRGLSNSVSNLLESIASSIPNTFERISSEDMLFSTKEANKIMAKVKEDWKKRRLEKLR